MWSRLGDWLLSDDVDLLGVRLNDVKYFAGGWGRVREGFVLTPPKVPEIVWGQWTFSGSDRTRVGRTGTFRTTDCTGLPEVVQTAHVQQWMPVVEKGEPIAVCGQHLQVPSFRDTAFVVCLPYTGDEGFSVREEMYARPLCAKGVCVCILMGAFYGPRRPSYQPTHKFWTVADFALVGRTNVEDTRLMLAWAKAQGFAKMCVAGVSMGASMGALAVQLFPDKVALGAGLIGCSAADAYVHGCMAEAVDWQALEQPGVDAKQALHAIMDRSSNLEHWPRPKVPKAVVLVGAMTDQYVPCESVQKVAKHFGCPPGNMHWIPGGHIVSIMTASGAFADAAWSALCALEQ